MSSRNSAFRAKHAAGAGAVALGPNGTALSHVMTMATAFVKSMGRPWKGSGRSCGAGDIRIGAYHKSNSPSNRVSSILCTTSASEAKRCLLRSLHCWPHKTLETTMSVCGIHRDAVAEVSRSRPQHVSHIGTEGDSMRGVHTPWQHAATR